VSAVDGDEGESSLSFMAQAATRAGSETNSIVIDRIVLPAGAVSFHVYRGSTTELLFRIASGQTPAPAFTDTGMPGQAVLPPDPQFDHVNVDWRWELLPETTAAIRSVTTVGNPALQLISDRYKSAVVRITRGTGLGQEHSILSNNATTITIDGRWSIEPDATSWFVIAESSWRSGARGAASPIVFDVPERIGSGLQISARAANPAGDEAVYALSPLTRWVLGQSGGIETDSAVPPAPSFGLVVSPTRGGVLDLGSPGFSSLVNTRGIIAGTYKFHYYDEINGLPPLTLNAPIVESDTSIALSVAPPLGALLQIEQEILQVTAINPDGTAEVLRGVHGTAVVDHNPPAVAWLLREKVVIVPFIKGFFGSPASGDWQYTVALPSARIASVELYMTNALGDGAITANAYTDTIDSGLRTLAGGQYSFQISGYLAIQTGAAPDVIIDADRSVRDLYGILRTPSAGASVTLQTNVNGAPYATVQFDDGATVSAVAPGFGLPALRTGDRLSLDITGVGTAIPGSDLTFIVRL
jgi:hypothetical protein